MNKLGQCYPGALLRKWLKSMQKTQALIVNQQLTFGNKKELLLIWAQSNNFTEKAQILIVFFGHFTCVTNCSKRSMPVLYAPRHACVGMLTQLCPTLCNLYGL